MKIVFFGELSADQAAMAVFAEGILGEPAELMDQKDSKGTKGTKDFWSLCCPFGPFEPPSLTRGVYYQTDAAGLVVVVDSDDTELHLADHDKPGNSDADCRLCQARKIIANARQHLRAKEGRLGLKVAIGLAVPAIEAWYLVGKNHQVGEASWRVGLAANRLPFTRLQLKELVYGTTRPSLEQETKCAVEEARRIIGKIRAIETTFPDGFGLMASEIRSWKA